MNTFLFILSLCFVHPISTCYVPVNGLSKCSCPISLALTNQWVNFSRKATFRERLRYPMPECSRRTYSKGWRVMQLPLCREPVRHFTHDKGHEEWGSAYAKAGSSLRSPPGYSRASTPKKPESACFIALCSHLWLGGCPPPPSRSLWQRVNLQLQLIKFLGIRSV